MSRALKTANAHLNRKAIGQRRRNLRAIRLLCKFIRGVQPGWCGRMKPMVTIRDRSNGNV